MKLTFEHLVNDNRKKKKTSQTQSCNTAALTDLLDDHSVVHRHVYN